MEQMNFLDMIDGKEAFKVTKTNERECIVEYFCKSCNKHHIFGEVYSGGRFGSSIAPVFSAITKYFKQLKHGQKLTLVMEQIKVIADEYNCGTTGF